MERDAGIALAELRVDGGAAANDLLMQFQADVLGVPVVRPQVLETTALGAAYLAGLAVGYWRSDDDSRANVQHRPALRAVDLARPGGAMHAGWDKAVARAKAGRNERSSPRKRGPSDVTSSPRKRGPSDVVIPAKAGTQRRYVCFGETGDSDLTPAAARPIRRVCRRDPTGFRRHRLLPRCDAREDRVQVLEAHRLHQVLVEAGVLHLAPIFVLAVARARDDHRVLASAGSARITRATS